ncbi:STN domain-containing protein [Sphingomonas sp. PB4P5]|uniref:STN domain-containing protein n=1 Tax=Parasphingomonas puruogangriensis TaxID=3096155 RepID=UPI002FC8AC66
MDILLNDSVASGRRSSAVAGRLSRPEALSRMLIGTGLTMRFTSPRSAVVYVIGQPPQQREAAARWSAPATLALDMMRVTAPRLIGGPARPPYRDYTFGLARDIQRKLVDAKVLVSGTPVVTRIGTRIDADGTLHHVEIVTPGSDRMQAQRVVSLLEGQRLADRPPADLPQPLIFDVRSR